MVRKTYLTILSVLVVCVMVGPLFCGNVSSAKNVKTPTYNLYFGDLHTHTKYSDAWEGTPWDAYQAAIDGGADFMATTDHIGGWHQYTGLALDSEEWADTLVAAEYFTSKKFVAIPAYETWLTANCGEINTYNVAELPVSDPLGNKFDRLPDYYDWLVEHPGAIGQFNHPYYMTDSYQDFDYYSEARDGVMKLIEVWNAKFTEDYFIAALDKGWHLMPTVNSDTHNPDWIAGYEMRTVLLAEKLSLENLYDAMSALRGYGTLDKNLRIYYTLNDAIMGSTLGSVASTVTAKINIEDPDGVASDAITKVEIVSDGGMVVAALDTDSTVVDWTVTLDSSEGSYFYVRVTTASGLDGVPGLTAWTAPVWTA